MTITAARVQSSPTRIAVLKPSTDSTAPARPLRPVRPDQTSTHDPAVWDIVWTVNAAKLQMLESADEGSTAVHVSEDAAAKTLDAELDHILAGAQYEEFEEGMSSEFEGRLKTLVGYYGEQSITALHARLQSGIKSHILIEALGALGRMRVRATLAGRVAVLARWLGNDAASVRYAAGCALLDLDVPIARGFLERAAGVEQNQLLRESLRKLARLVR